MTLARSSATIGGLTLLSRLLGFVRDMLVAHFLGASIFTDAFFVAFKLPNFLRRLFAEGAFNAGFLPMFAGMVKTEGRKEALEFASEAGRFLFWVLLAVTGLGIAFMPVLMPVLAPGFDADPEKFALTVSLTRITFCYILFISLVSLLGGVLNSVDKFGAVAATPIWMNVCFIGGLWLFRPFVPNDAYAFAWAVALAGAVQFLWLVWAARRAGVLPRLFGWPRWSPRIKRLLWLIAPAALGAGMAQISLLVDMMLASILPGNAVSYLYYADRLYELPLGVIGIAVSTALLPLLSREIKAGEMDSARTHLNQSLQLVLLFGLPSAAALLVIAHPIIRVIFEQGEFSAADTAMVVPTLVAFALGLPAFLLTKIFASVFYASQDTKTPTRISVSCLLVNFVLNVVLMQFMAHVGLALSTSIAGWLSAILLGFGLYRRGLFAPDRALGIFITKTLLACAGMAALLYGLTGPLMPWIDHADLARRILGLAVLIAAGGTVWAATMLTIGGMRLGNLKTLLRPRRPVPAQTATAAMIEGEDS